MIFIVDGGIVYEFTRSQYKKLLRAIASGGSYSLGTLGKQLGHHTNVNGLTPIEAEERLSKLSHS